MALFVRTETHVQVTYQNVEKTVVVEARTDEEISKSFFEILDTYHPGSDPGNWKVIDIKRWVA
jgi:hypothetical protein